MYNRKVLSRNYKTNELEKQRQYDKIESRHKLLSKQIWKKAQKKTQCQSK